MDRIEERIVFIYVGPRLFFPVIRTFVALFALTWPRATDGYCIGSRHYKILKSTLWSNPACKCMAYTIHSS